MPAPNDTSPEAEAVLIDCYRRMLPQRKWLMLGRDFAWARRLHASGLHQRRPHASPEDVLQEWNLIHYGYTGSRTVSGATVDHPQENLQVVTEVTEVLSKLGIAHALGGSMASSIHGIGRFTRDADLSAEPFPGKEKAFVASFGDECYLSLVAVEEAVRKRSSFNLIHTTTGFKVDVFIQKDTAFEHSARARRLRMELPDQPGQFLTLPSAEDVVLFKLRCEISDQQWSDVLGILKVKAGNVDESYLDQWAGDLGVADLLTRARADALPAKFVGA